MTPRRILRNGTYRCSACGSNPVRGEGQRYCAPCHASWMRVYRAAMAGRDRVIEDALRVIQENVKQHGLDRVV